MIFLTSLIVIIIVFEVRNRIFDLLVTIISLISEMGIKPRMKRRVNRGRNFLFYSIYVKIVSRLPRTLFRNERDEEGICIGMYEREMKNGHECE